MDGARTSTRARSHWRVEGQVSARSSLPVSLVRLVGRHLAQAAFRPFGRDAAGRRAFSKYTRLLRLRSFIGEIMEQ